MNKVLSSAWVLGSLFLLATTACSRTPSLPAEASLKANRPPSENMVDVEAGPFKMGDNYGEQQVEELDVMRGNSDARPVHLVWVSKFSIERCEVSWELWTAVREWALVHGYAFDHKGSARAPNHPVQNVCWFCAAKWCNARSEMAALEPVYYATSDYQSVYKAGNGSTPKLWARFDASGYRLPTEAEWEKAARGGLDGHQYPWPSQGPAYYRHINDSCANAWQDSRARKASQTDALTTPVGWYNGRQTPAGGDMTNAYGLYDMAGNVYEWCWDWYSTDWYREPAAQREDPRGPDFGKERVARGGSWRTSKYDLRCSVRGFFPPAVAYNHVGFRCVRSAPTAKP